MQTPSEPAGVWVEEFGEAYYISLVAELDDGTFLYIGEYESQEFTGDSNALVPVELVQEEYDLADVEGNQITGMTDSSGEFAIAIENGLFLRCESAPGGNFPWIFCPDDIEGER